jgi:hypothetical protein
MATYKNLRAGAIWLSSYSGNEQRMIGPVDPNNPATETFTAHPDEIPPSWLKHGIVEKVSDLPEVAAPAKPEVTAGPTTKDELQVASKLELMKAELAIEQLKNETERLKRGNLETEAALRTQDAAKAEPAKAADPKAADPKAADPKATEPKPAKAADKEAAAK